MTLLLLGAGAFGQFGTMAVIRTTDVSGSFEPLKNETSVNVEFTYEGMLVGSFTEEKYIEKKVKEYNADEAGRGDKWAQSWVNDRGERFHPMFVELFNDRTSGQPLAGVGKTDARYTIIVKTLFTEPGYNIGISRMSAYINASIQLVESASPSTVVGELQITNCPGGGAMGFDFDTGTRLSEAYAKLGKELGAYLMKKVWGRKK